MKEANRSANWKFKPIIMNQSHREKNRTVRTERWRIQNLWTEPSSGFDIEIWHFDINIPDVNIQIRDLTSKSGIRHQNPGFWRQNPRLWYQNLRFWNQNSRTLRKKSISKTRLFLLDFPVNLGGPRPSILKVWDRVLAGFWKAWEGSWEDFCLN